MDTTRLKRTGFASLASMVAARAGFLASVQPLQAIEDVPIDASLGRVLARDIKARFPVPWFDKSAMDGYAINASDSFGASVQDPRELRVAGRVAIEDEPSCKVIPGSAVKVATGSVIPAGADAVIKIEDTDLDSSGERVLVYKQIVPGGNIIQSGEDYGENQIVLATGRKVRPEDIGVLATLGHSRVTVTRHPRVAIFATGNELVDLGDLHADETGVADPRRAGPCKLVDSNRHAIGAFVTMAGGIVARAMMLPDDENVIKDEISAAIASCDMVVTTGGTSVGERDFIPTIISSHHEVLYHGIAMKPGAATLLGTSGGKPIIGASGFPVAAEIAMLYFGMPAIRKLAGESVLDPRIRVHARISDAVAVKGFGMTRLLRVKIDHGDILGNELPRAIPVKLSGSGMQRSMIESDGFVEISPDIEGYEAGDVVVVVMHP